MTLTGRAKKVDADAIIAQRLKRLTSTAAKLRRFPRLILSEIQDIGGCRSVVSTSKRVRELVKLYEDARGKSPHRGPELLWVKDYIKEPKRSGYRSYHLVYQYRTDSPELQVFNGHRIEIQLRSAPQHAWATAVETVDAFTHQSLKSNLGTAPWKRFFALMGSVVALREREAPVPGTLVEKHALREELRAVEQQIGAKSILEHLQVVTFFTRDQTHAVAFLLKLDTVEGRLEATPYTHATLARATDDYLAMEKEISGNPAIQAVLVSVDKLENLRKAYPNYYVDLDLFLRMLGEPLGLTRVARSPASGG